MNSPDRNSFGFLKDAPDALRYDYQSTDPDNVARKLASLIAPDSRVLDVGCGSGAVTELIKQWANTDVIGVEPDLARAAVARQRGLHVFDGILTEALLQKHGPFDTILFADVLEHLPNPAELVMLAKSGLAPKGSIVASVPNVAQWFIRTNLMRGRFNYRDCGIMDATHLRWFSHDGLHNFFNNLGFGVTDHLYTMNVEAAEYQESRPWKWLSEPNRRRLVRRLVRLSPRLFGVQHVIRAVPLV